MNTVAQGVEVCGTGNFPGDRFCALKQHAAQVLTVLIFADEFADVLATSRVPAAADLFVNKGFECDRQGNVHAAHGWEGKILGNFWQARAVSRFESAVSSPPLRNPLPRREREQNGYMFAPFILSLMVGKG